MFPDTTELYDSIGQLVMILVYGEAQLVKPDSSS